VSDTRPRLRSAVQSYRHHYRGRQWHVLSDPANNQFFRLDEAGYHFVGLLDGRRTVDEVWRVCNEHLADDAPTQGEVIQLLGQLYTSDLLQSDMPPDAQQMFERYRKRRRREIGSYLKSFLYLQLPLVDPNTFLQKSVFLVGWLFTPIGMLIWLGLLATGFYHVVGRWDELLAGADPQVMLSTENLVTLWTCFAGIKLIHELGHGYACAYFGRKGGAGGQVHTLGIMLLVFMPTPYVDASSSWTFRNKWHRAFVGAGGMYFELAVAAMAAVAWSYLGENQPALKAIMYNLMFIASVSTVVFNANPLLRFDGYYILSDLLEIANLYQRSQAHLKYLVRRHAFGVRHAHSTAHGPGEQAWFFFYAIAASIYRVFVTLGIMLYVADRFFVLGTIMAISAFVGWLVTPSFQFLKYLLIGTELERVRLRAVTATVAFAAVLIGVLGWIPVPDRGRADGVVEPRRIAIVFTGADGRVTSMLPSGTKVAPTGAPLVAAENRRLAAELAESRASVKAAMIKREIARERDPAEAQALAEQIAALDQRVQRIQTEIDALTISAPFPGVWVSPESASMVGAYLKRGERVGLVADLDDLLLRISADQDLGPRIVPEIGVGEKAEVELRVKGRPELLFTGIVEQVLPAGQSQLPSAALGYQAGGTMAVAADDQSGTKSAEPFFEVHIKPKVDFDPATIRDDQRPLLVGQRVVVRFTMPSKPILTQAWRYIQQAMQQRFSLPG
jgi:putative peptide zinc metalloprotease protein